MDDILKGAVISDCGKYRYSLMRRWNAMPSVLFIMLNPSTADAEVDDATIRSCIRLTKSWGYGGIEVVNLFAFRATDPKELYSADDPVGSENDEHIADAVAHTDFPLCAWGAQKITAQRAGNVVELLKKRGALPHCLGTTKSGAPKHPLYIKTGTVPVLFRPGAKP